MSSSNQFSDQVDTSSSATATTVGATLRAAREKAGLTRDELARRLCMTPDKLDALEQDAFERFAGVTYVRGYIRNLCKELGLDAAAVMAAFARQVPEEVAPVAVRTPVGTVMGQRPENRDGSLLGPFLLVLALAAGGGYWWLDQRADSGSAPMAPSGAQGGAQDTVDVPAAGDLSMYESIETSEAPLAGEAADSELTPGEGEPESVAEPGDGMPETDAEVGESGDSDALEPAADAADEEPTPPATKPEVESSPSAATPADAAAAEAPVEERGAETAAGAPRLVINFQQESWVEVTDATGYKMLAKLQPAGSSVRLSGRAPFSVMLGNAAAATVTFDGQVVDSSPIGNRRTRKLSVGG